AATGVEHPSGQQALFREPHEGRLGPADVPRGGRTRGVCVVPARRRHGVPKYLIHLVVRTEHRLEPAAGGLTRIVYRTQITGAAADSVGPELGPQITADFPEVVAALAGRAEG